MDMDWPILSVLIWLPILGGIGVMALGQDRAQLARVLSLSVTTIALIIAAVLYMGFSNATAQMQFAELSPWVSTFNINYHLGVDGLSLPLILLTAFFGPLIVLAGWEVIKKNVHQYMAAFLVMQGLMIGMFCALDAMLFYVFFEAMLIPMFLVIGMWGGPNRVYATIKFFLVYLPGFSIHADRPDLPVQHHWYLVDS